MASPDGFYEVEVEWSVNRVFLVRAQSREAVERLLELGFLDSCRELRYSSWFDVLHIGPYEGKEESCGELQSSVSTLPEG